MQCSISFTRTKTNYTTIVVHLFGFLSLAMLFESEFSFGMVQSMLNGSKVEGLGAPRLDRQVPWGKRDIDIW